MCVILDLCKTRGRGKKTWNGAPFLIFTGAPKVLSEFAPRGYVILDTPLQPLLEIGDIPFGGVSPNYWVKTETYPRLKPKTNAMHTHTHPKIQTISENQTELAGISGIQFPT